MWTIRTRYVPLPLKELLAQQGWQQRDDASIGHEQLVVGQQLTTICKLLVLLSQLGNTDNLLKEVGGGAR